MTSVAIHPETLKDAIAVALGDRVKHIGVALGEVTLTVAQGRQHPGCINVLMPEIATGLELSQTASKQWIGLVTVSADKAYLLKTPGAKAAKRPYIVKHDVVGVLAFKDGWAQVEFINADDRSFTGWISQAQYARLAAPKP